METLEITVKSQENGRLGVRMEKARVHVPMKSHGTRELKGESPASAFSRHVVSEQPLHRPFVTGYFQLFDGQLMGRTQLPLHAMIPTPSHWK